MAEEGAANTAAQTKCTPPVTPRTTNGAAEIFSSTRQDVRPPARDCCTWYSFRSRMIYTFLVSSRGNRNLIASLAATSADGEIRQAYSCCREGDSGSIGLAQHVQCRPSLCKTSRAARRLEPGLGTTTQTLRGPLAFSTEVAVLRNSSSVVHLMTRQPELCTVRIERNEDMSQVATRKACMVTLSVT